MSGKTINYKDLPPLDSKVTNRMGQEMKMCMILFAVYAFYLFIVPILTFQSPELMKTRVWGGMSLTWFMTSIGAMIMAFAIAAIHVYVYTKDFFITETTTEKTTKGAGM